MDFRRPGRFGFRQPSPRAAPAFSGAPGASGSPAQGRPKALRARIYQKCPGRRDFNIVLFTLEQIMDFRRPRRFRQPSPRAAQSLKDKNVTTYAITYTIAYSKET